MRLDTDLLTSLRVRRSLEHRVHETATVRQAGAGHCFAAVSSLYPYMIKADMDEFWRQLDH